MIAEKFGKELLFEAQLPLNAEIKVRDALAARQIAETTEAEAQARLADAVRELAKAGLSTRDAAVVLKLSIHAECVQVERGAYGLEAERRDIRVGRVAAHEVHQ